MERRAGISYDDFADLEPFQDFRGAVGRQSDPYLARLDRVALDDLNGEMVDRGLGDRDAAASLGVDRGAGEHADLQRGIVGDADADAAELRGAVDLGRNQPDPADQIGRVVSADADGGAGAELWHVH